MGGGEKKPIGFAKEKSYEYIVQSLREKSYSL